MRKFVRTPREPVVRLSPLFILLVAVLALSAPRGTGIAVGDTEGAVERIELRATQIRTYEGRLALVPNADVFTSRIVDNTADPIRRGSVRLMLHYKTDLAALMPCLCKAVQQAAGVLDRPVTVHIEDLTLGGVHLGVGFWTDPRQSDFKDTSSAVRLALVAALAKQGVAMPEAEFWHLDQSTPAMERAAETTPGNIQPRGSDVG